MGRYNVYAISDWPENMGEEFLIYENKEFESIEAAIEAGKKVYDDLEIFAQESWGTNHEKLV